MLTSTNKSKQLIYLVYKD